MADIGRQLYQAHFGHPDLATPDQVREPLRQAAAEVEDLRFSLRFLWTEWSRVVDAWQLASWEQYRDVPRLGRRTRLPERQRELLWSVFSKVAAALDEHGLLTEPRLFGRLERQIAKMARPPFEFCVVDEAQDIGVAELRFLAALGSGRPDALFFAGDLGQRIFQTPFSWRALGVDIRGRSHTLRVNYRTSHQIRRQADRLLPPETSDVDGNTDRRTGTVSVFNGAEPVIHILPSHDAETAAIAEWLKSPRAGRVCTARDGRVRPIEGRTGQSHRGGWNGRVCGGRSGAARKRRHEQRCSRHDAPRKRAGISRRSRRRLR